MRKLIVPALVLGLGVAGAAAKPLFLRGGVPNGAGSAQACGSGGVCAQFQDGQTFVTWTDADTDAAGGSFRYRVYRSNAPIDAGNYAGASLIASYVFNNSGQLVGGNPDTGGASFTQANRQNAAQPMSKLSFGGTAMDAFTGLQAYTALAAENAYYAVVSTDTSDGSPSYIGSVGPIAESEALPLPVKYADSLSRPGDGGYGRITSSAGLPIVLALHASGGCSGPAPFSAYGDYWQWWLPKESGWQDGRAAVLTVLRDNGSHIASFTNALEVWPCDSIWNPAGTGAIETFHQGIGMTPNPLVGSANRWYPTTAKGYERFLRFVIDHYGADPNQIHLTGTSMGAWGSVSGGMRMTDPHVSAVWAKSPVWRMDRRGSAGWAGNTWSTWPFRATIGAAPSTLGTTAASVQMPDGSAWGGTGGYADIPSFVAADPGADLPVAIWGVTKRDGFAGWLEQIEAVDALRQAGRGHAFVWAYGGHNYVDMASVNCDAAGADGAACYGKPLFQLDLPYIAFSNSSIDDDPGTATLDGSGIYDGDHVGCINCGFKWTVSLDSSSEFNFTVDNVWMDRSPTTVPQTTLTSGIASSGVSSFGVTDNSGFLSTSTYNQYFLVGGTEIIWGTTTAGSDSITVLARGQLGTTAQSHSAGATIIQFPGKATGPNGGPFSTMTVDITVRRAQGFVKPNGTTINCTATPDGGSPEAKSGTVTGSEGVFTLTGITINATGATGIACN